MHSFKTPDQVPAFIKNQVRFLISKLNVFTNVSIAVGTYNKFFDSDNITEFFNPNFFWNATPENRMQDKFEHYIKYSKNNPMSSGSVCKPEPSGYKSFGTIYLIHPYAYFEMQFIEEFKSDGKILFKQFAYTSGKVNHQFPFVEINSDWEEGVKSTARSFKDAICSTNEFIFQRCGKRA